jgi:hypothetical protein
MQTILVLGGYGFFGQRTSAALASTAPVLKSGRLESVVAEDSPFEEMPL